MILLLLSLVAGILTVLAPCTISLLPVIVGGAVGGEQSHNRKRAYVVTASLGVSVILFTLLLKFSTSLIAIPQSFWQIVSGGIILALGLTMLFPELWEKLSFAGMMNRSSNKLLAQGYQKKSFAGDILIGAALGPVFSSCSPTYFLIIATVLPRSLSEGIVYLLAYALGLCGGLLVVTLLSQKIIEKLGIAADPKGWLKRGIGIIFILLGAAILFGLDKQLELAVASNIFDVTKIEQGLLATQSKPEMPNGTGDTTTVLGPVNLDAAARTAAKALAYPKAPEITNPSGFVNTDGKPVTLAEFKGKKAVLVDFWTYSCINCQRTLPYLKAWYDKYSSEGLEIVSIHTPEFAFEKLQSNVEAAVKSFGIKYPVVLDNQYGTWSAFRNQYWPRKYLIDIDGYIVYDHAGEGDYDVTEAQIQKVLAERAQVLGISAAMPTGTVAPKDVVTAEGSKIGSPEIYFGSSRNEYLANGIQGIAGAQKLTLPGTFIQNSLYLSGTWNMTPEFAQSGGTGAKIVYKYQSKDVYFVASSDAGAHLRILVDGKPAGSFGGADVKADGTVLVNDNRLYKIVQGADYGTHTLEIQVLDGTLDAYTFTFG